MMEEVNSSDLVDFTEAQNECSAEQLPAFDHDSIALSEVTIEDSTVIFNKRPSSDDTSSVN